MLGVYVMHPFFIICLGYLGFKATNFNLLIGIPLVTLCVFFICLVFSEAIKRIPYLNKII
jgi:surface polysaccharide O-acyltransferase-like enzyme